MNLIGVFFFLFFRYKLQFPFNEFTANNRGVALFKNGESEYDIETLLAMILWSAKKTTEAYAEQSVKVRVNACVAYKHPALPMCPTMRGSLMTTVKTP